MAGKRTEDRIEQMELIIKHLQNQQAGLKRIVEQCLDARRKDTAKKGPKKR